MPGGQGRQVTGELAPGVEEKVPTKQDVQVRWEEAPAEVLKVPAGQGVGFVELRGQKDPAGHRMGAPLEQE